MARGDGALGDSLTGREQLLGDLLGDWPETRYGQIAVVLESQGVHLIPELAECHCLYLLRRPLGWIHFRGQIQTNPVIRSPCDKAGSGRPALLAGVYLLSRRVARESGRGRRAYLFRKT